MELLRTEKVTMQFGGLKAVNEVDMTIEAGEIRALIGPNGAGKSTLFNVISGLYTPTSGKVFFMNEDIGKLRPDQVTSRGIARTFQNILLFNEMTALENVMVGRHCRTATSILTDIIRTPKMIREEKNCRQRSEEILDFIGLKDKKEWSAGNLPYGQKRLLEIARALASDPKLLMLDEPAAGMNHNETSALMKMILKIREMGVTVLLVEHNMRLAMGLADQLTVVDHGAKIAEGVADVIRNDKQVIEAYLGKEEE